MCAPWHVLTQGKQQQLTLRCTETIFEISSGWSLQYSICRLMVGLQHPTVAHMVMGHSPGD